MPKRTLSPNAALEAAMHDSSRRDFLKILCALVGAAVLTPIWQIKAGGQKLAVPPTLMLHSKDRYKLHNILVWLQDNGYSNLTYRQFASVIRGEMTLPDKPIILTIDDIGSDYIQPAFPQMIDMIEKAGYIGMLGVVTNATPGKNPGNWATLKEIAARGWELDTHTTHHYDLPQLKTVDEMRAEVVDSAQMITDGVGQTPTSLIVPFAAMYIRGGAFDQRIFDVSSEAKLDFVVGMKEGRYVDTDQPPIYLGRVGVGVDSVQTGWWITHFNVLNPGEQE